MVHVTPPPPEIPFRVRPDAHLVVGVALPAVAQDGESTQDDATTLPEQADETGFGVLQVSAVTCAGDESGAVSILLASEFGGNGDCVDGSSALLVDGVDQGIVAPYLEIQLEAGIHTSPSRIRGRLVISRSWPMASPRSSS